MLRFISLIGYLFVRSLHTRFPGGRALRARLANNLAYSVARSANIEPGVRLSRGVEIREQAGVGADTRFLGQGHVVLGERLKMGPQCIFITNDHPIPPTDRTFSQHGGMEGSIIVGTDVFIGARVIVLPNVTIGDGAAIGAGCVVSRDIPAMSVCVGNPARVIRERSGSPQGPHSNNLGHDQP